MLHIRNRICEDLKKKKWITNTELLPVSLKLQNVSGNFQQFLDKINSWMNSLTCVRSARVDIIE